MSYTPRKRAWQLLRRYGITDADYDRMLSEQGGVCAVCHQPETALDPKSKKPIALAVDHDHKTGVVRGLLCRKCNTSLGALDDDPLTLLAAASYLVRHARKEDANSSH